MPHKTTVCWIKIQKFRYFLLLLVSIPGVGRSLSLYSSDRRWMCPPVPPSVCFRQGMDMNCRSHRNCPGYQMCCPFACAYGCVRPVPVRHSDEYEYNQDDDSYEFVLFPTKHNRPSTVRAPHSKILSLAKLKYYSKMDISQDKSTIKFYQLQPAVALSTQFISNLTMTTDAGEISDRNNIVLEKSAVHGPKIRNRFVRLEDPQRERDDHYDEVGLSNINYDSEIDKSEQSGMMIVHHNNKVVQARINPSQNIQENLGVKRVDRVLIQPGRKVIEHMPKNGDKSLKSKNKQKYAFDRKSGSTKNMKGDKNSLELIGEITLAKPNENALLVMSTERNEVTGIPGNDSLSDSDYKDAVKTSTERKLAIHLENCYTDKTARNKSIGLKQSETIPVNFVFNIESTKLLKELQTKLKIPADTTDWYVLLISENVYPLEVEQHIVAPNVMPVNIKNNITFNAKVTDGVLDRNNNLQKTGNFHAIIKIKTKTNINNKSNVNVSGASHKLLKQTKQTLQQNKKQPSNQNVTAVRNKLPRHLGRDNRNDGAFDIQALKYHQHSVRTNDTAKKFNSSSNNKKSKSVENTILVKSFDLKASTEVNIKKVPTSSFPSLKYFKNHTMNQNSKHRPSRSKNNTNKYKILLKQAYYETEPKSATVGLKQEVLQKFHGLIRLNTPEKAALLLGNQITNIDNDNGSNKNNFHAVFRFKTNNNSKNDDKILHRSAPKKLKVILDKNLNNVSRKKGKHLKKYQGSFQFKTAGKKDSIAINSKNNTYENTVAKNHSGAIFDHELQKANSREINFNGAFLMKINKRSTAEISNEINISEKQKSSKEPDIELLNIYDEKDLRSILRFMRLTDFKTTAIIEINIGAFYAFQLPKPPPAIVSNKLIRDRQSKSATFPTTNLPLPSKVLPASISYEDVLGTCTLRSVNSVLMNTNATHNEIRDDDGMTFEGKHPTLIGKPFHHILRLKNSNRPDLKRLSNIIMIGPEALRFGDYLSYNRRPKYIHLRSSKGDASRTQIEHLARTSKSRDSVAISNRKITNVQRSNNRTNPIRSIVMRHLPRAKDEGEKTLNGQREENHSKGTLTKLNGEASYRSNWNLILNASNFNNATNLEPTSFILLDQSSSARNSTHAHRGLPYQILSFKAQNGFMGDEIKNKTNRKNKWKTKISPKRVNSGIQHIHNWRPYTRVIYNNIKLRNVSRIKEILPTPKYNFPREKHSKKYSKINTRLKIYRKYKLPASQRNQFHGNVSRQIRKISTSYSYSTEENIDNGTKSKNNSLFESNYVFSNGKRQMKNNMNRWQLKNGKQWWDNHGASNLQTIDTTEDGMSNKRSFYKRRKNKFNFLKRRKLGKKVGTKLPTFSEPSKVHDKRPFPGDEQLLQQAMNIHKLKDEPDHKKENLSI